MRRAGKKVDRREGPRHLADPVTFRNLPYADNRNARTTVLALLNTPRTFTEAMEYCTKELPPDDRLKEGTFKKWWARLKRDEALVVEGDSSQVPDGKFLVVPPDDRPRAGWFARRRAEKEARALAKKEADAYRRTLRKERALLRAFGRGTEGVAAKEAEVDALETARYLEIRRRLLRE